MIGSVLFSLGSVLSWAVIKSVLPKDSSALYTVVGLGTGVLIVRTATDYFDTIDSAVAKK